MPKVAKSVRAKCEQYIREFGNETFTTDGNVLLCNYCSKAITSEKRSQVTQHLQTASHIAAERRKDRKKQTIMLRNQQACGESSKKSQYFKDLCEAFMSADIPFAKLQNDKFSAFLEKYTSEKTPSDSGIRKNYFPELYEDVIKRIREKLEEKLIWVSVDETTDDMGRYVANVIVGSVDSLDSTHLIHTVFLDHTDHSTIAKTVNDALHILWPGGIKYDNVVLFVTDAARYMLKAGRALQLFYTKMLHITCLAHGIHRVCEKIRELFPAVNSLISSVKKVFLKAPSRIQHFREKAPDLALPPQPVITRWGTWLDAALYYADNFDLVKEIVNAFDPEDAVCIREAQESLKVSSLQANLAYIKANLAFLVETITKLESRMLLVEAVKLVNGVHKKLQQLPNSRISSTIKQKMDFVLENNPNWKDVNAIAEILSGESETLLPNYNSATVASFIYAPVTSCDVERSFSMYKSVLRKNRQSFMPENLKMYIVTHCFQ